MFDELDDTVEGILESKLDLEVYHRFSKASVYKERIRNTLGYGIRHYLDSYNKDAFVVIRCGIDNYCRRQGKGFEVDETRTHDLYEIMNSFKVYNRNPKIDKLLKE